jgi:cysteinyl-tRNA synthetase
MDDDFNAPQAVAAMFDLVREINRGHEKGMDVGKAQDMLKELAGVIGFTLQETKRLSDEEAVKIEDLIAKRNGYRLAKEWKLADEVRAQLTSMGVAIEDTAKGTTWKVSR